MFDVVKYDGTGATQTISGLAFEPDFVWLKMRSASDRNILTDIVRGVTNTLNSDSTRDEATATEPGQVTAYTPTGFTLGNNSNVNGSGSTYVAWAWDAGTTTASNPDGSITSQVRANVSAGFSVVTYTGTGAVATVGHGLGVAPQLIIARPRNAVSNWVVYHASEGAGKFLRLNTTDSSTTDSTAWNNTTPTSTVYSVGNNAANGSGLSVIAYCFAPVVGYSSFGAWVGSGTTNDGAFIYTGFRPRFILLKNSDNVEQWYIYDSARRTYNVQYPDPTELRPNSSGAEGSASLAVTLDFLSNGFKIRGNTGAEISFVGRNYIYAAFAESPFQYARAR